jgi:hypothetical protein
MLVVMVVWLPVELFGAASEVVETGLEANVTESLTFHVKF